jgi:CRISPR-associated protein Cas2
VSPCETHVHRQKSEPQSAGALVTVVVLIAAPEGIRGHFTRWMIEVAAGVFVGSPSLRVRDKVWAILSERIGSGQAVVIEPAANEQRWEFGQRGRIVATRSTMTD